MITTRGLKRAWLIYLYNLRYRGRKKLSFIWRKSAQAKQPVFYRLIILTAFFLLNIFTANCQQTIKDSLVRLLKNTSENKEKVLIYLDYGKTFDASNPDSAQLFYEKAKDLATRLNDLKGMTKYLSYQINFFNQKGQFEDGLATAQKDVAITRQLKDTKILIKAYNDVANSIEGIA